MTIREEPDGRLKFPMRILNRKRLVYTFNIDLGYDLKYKLRNIARAQFSQIYHKRIIFPSNPQYSEENDMTVGRWIFGIPGYKGHIIAYENKAWLPEDSPEIAKELLRKTRDSINEEA